MLRDFEELSRTIIFTDILLYLLSQLLTQCALIIFVCTYHWDPARAVLTTWSFVRNNLRDILRKVERRGSRDEFQFRFCQIKRISWRRDQSRDCRREWFGTSVCPCIELDISRATYQSLKSLINSDRIHDIANMRYLPEHQNFLFPSCFSSVTDWWIDYRALHTDAYTQVTWNKFSRQSVKKNYESLIIRCPQINLRAP